MSSRHPLRNPYKKNNDHARMVEDPKGTQDFSRDETMLQGKQILSAQRDHSYLRLLWSVLPPVGILSGATQEELLRCTFSLLWILSLLLPCIHNG